MRSRGAFTLVETAAVILVAGVLMGLAAPLVNGTRADAAATGSARNLHLIGVGHAMYGVDNGGRIATYSWRGPRLGDESSVIYWLPDGRSVVARDDVDAAGAQNTAMLMEATGRIEGPFRIRTLRNRLPHRRLWNQVLSAYLQSPVIDEMFADPADRDQLLWQRAPLNYLPGSTVPYVNGTPPGKYDNSSSWRDVATYQRWSFSSSYQPTYSAWNTDYEQISAAYVPVESTPHLAGSAIDFGRGGGCPPTIICGGGGGTGVIPFVPLAEARSYREVVFPANKVHMFEEFDRGQAGSPYFAYNHATPEKLMFDGSVNSLASGFASPSEHPQTGEVWEQTYIPLDGFPIPLGGLGDDTLLSMRYRWTPNGLSGIDYARRDLQGSGRPQQQP